MLTIFAWRWLRFDPGLAHLRAALTTMVCTLLSFWSVLQLKGVATIHVDLVVLAIGLPLVLSQSLRGADTVNRLVALLVVPAATVGATEVGSVIADHPTLGDSLLVIAMSGGIWIRRFGPRFSKAGTVATLPFIANLVKPVPQPTGTTYLLWAALVALIAFAWVSVLHFITQTAGKALAAVRSPVVSTRSAHQPAGDPGATPAAQAVVPARRRRLSASTRMAIQIATALAGAFVIGREHFPDHWVWPVLTAYIVSSGNRGRADVLFKGLLRALGALVGTTVASLLFVGVFGPGSGKSIVAIFVILAFGVWLRPVNYAFWACFVTAALAFMYGYFGQSNADLLHTRLEGIVVGGLLAISAAWFILPLRTEDVLRLRRADALAALTDLLTAVRNEPAQLPYLQARFDRAVQELNHIAPPLETLRMVTRAWRGRPHQADSIDMVRRTVRPVHVIVQYASGPEALDQRGLNRISGVVSANLGALRRAMADHRAPEHRQLPQLQTEPQPPNRHAMPPDAAPPVALAAAALADLDAAVSSLGMFYLSTLSPRHARPRRAADQGPPVSPAVER